MNKQQEQSQKPKNSKLAIAALLIPVAIWGCGICIFELGDRFGPNSEAEAGSFWYLLGLSAVWLILFSGPAGITLGALALNRIKNSAGELKGRRFAIEGMIIAVVLECLFILFAVAMKVLSV